MIPANDASGESSIGSKRVFIDAFIRNAHQILLAGYSRLDAPAYQSSEEDEITGDLASSMTEAIGCNPAPWMRIFQVHDQHPVTAPGGPGFDRRVGKRRWKIDLQFVANTGSGFHRFSWEAKRLGTGHSISTYLGPAGLGCFLNGQYASDCDFGGMIGYAQSDDEEFWYESLFREVRKMPELVEVAENSKSPNSPFRSKHARKGAGTGITIYHTILRFN